MESKNSLLIPYGSSTYIIGFISLLFLLPLFLCFDISSGRLSNGSIIVLVITLILFSILQIYEYNKETQSLTIFWGLGFPAGKLFIKLPWVQQSYLGKRITKIGIFHEIKRDNTSWVTSKNVDTYPVRAMIDSEWIDIGGATRQRKSSLQPSKDMAYKISEFLDVPIVDMSV
jgi:hypothetical protein